MTEEQMILTPAQTATIKSKLSNILQNTSEDAYDLIEYTLAMIVNGKPVDYIVDELKGMEMDICDSEACDSIGNEILKFLQDIEKEKKSSKEKTTIQFNKGSTENALTKSGALGSKKTSNALSMSSGLSSGRDRDAKRDQSGNDRHPREGGRDGGRGRDGRGRFQNDSRGGRSIVSESFQRLSGGRQRDDRREGGHVGRGGGRDSGRGGERTDRSGRGKEWQIQQKNKSSRDTQIFSGKVKRTVEEVNTKDPNKRPKRDETEANLNKNSNHKQEQEQEPNDYQENVEEENYYEYEGQQGYDYNVWNGWDDGSGYYGYNYGYSGYDPSYWANAYQFYGGRGRGRGRGRGGRGRGGRFGEGLKEPSDTISASVEVVDGGPTDVEVNKGSSMIQGSMTDEATIAAAAVSASPLVGAHFSKYSYSSGGRTPMSVRGGRGRGRGGRGAFVAEKLATMTWSRSKATATSNEDSASQPQPDESS